MKKQNKAILKANNVVEAEKAAMRETIKNVEASIVSYDSVLVDIEKEINELQTLRAASLASKKEAIDYRNKLSEIVGE